MTTDNRLDEIRRWLRIQTSMEDVAARNRISPGESKNEARLRGHIEYLIQLLDARPAVSLLSEEESQLVIGAIPLQALPEPVVAGDAREIANEYALGSEDRLKLAQRITTHATQRYREGVGNLQSATVEALRGTKENYTPVNRALEIVVNSAAALLQESE